MSKRLFQLLSRLFHQESCLFINSHEVLPEPLSPDEERELVLRLKEGDEEAKNKLIEHNLRLVVYIAKKFENTGINIEDLTSIGSIGLIKSVMTFNPDKTSSWPPMLPVALKTKSSCFAEKWQNTSRG